MFSPCIKCLLVRQETKDHDYVRFERHIHGPVFIVLTPPLPPHRKHAYSCLLISRYTHCDANSAVFAGILNRIKRANDMLVTSAVCCCYCAKNTENVEHQLCDCNRDHVFQLLFADTCGRWRPNCMVLSLLNWCFRVEKPDFVTGCKNSMILRRYCVVNSLTSSDLNR